MDNNDNPVIQGLEALLGSEDFPMKNEISHSKSFEEMRTRFRDSFSLDQSKDSGVSSMAFANLSYRHIPSGNTSLQNQSIESGVSGDLFDTPFCFKPSVRNVSFDGCFIEDDFTPIAADLAPKSQGNFKGALWNTTHTAGILSSAVSQGGDIKSKVSPSSINIQEAYTMVKYTHVMRKCWNSITCIRKLRTQLTQNPTTELEYPMEWNLMCLLNIFKDELLEMQKDFSDLKLSQLLNEIHNSLELVYTNIGCNAMDWKMLKQLQRLTSNLFLALYSQCVSQNSLSSPSENKFRFEKRFQIWNSLA